VREMLRWLWSDPIVTGLSALTGLGGEYQPLERRHRPQQEGGLEQRRLRNARLSGTAAVHQRSRSGAALLRAAFDQRQTVCRFGQQQSDAKRTENAAQQPVNLEHCPWSQLVLVSALPLSAKFWPHFWPAGQTVASVRRPSTAT